MEKDATSDTIFWHYLSDKEVDTILGPSLSAGQPHHWPQMPTLGCDDSDESVEDREYFNNSNILLKCIIMTSLIVQIK